MQGAAAAGAEAPGLEAAREQAASEAAVAAAVDPARHAMLSLAEARIKGEQYLKIGTAAEVINFIGSIPDGLVEKFAGWFWDQVSLDVALTWFHEAGAKLKLCSYQYYHGIRECRFNYDEWSTPSILGLSIGFINVFSAPTVEKCYSTAKSPFRIGAPEKVCIGLKDSVPWWLS